MDPMFRRVAIAVAALTATAFIAVGQPASAAVGSTSITWTSLRIDLGRPAVARVAGTRGFNVTINWGDGTKSSATCARKSCSKPVRHVYAKAGKFRVSARSKHGLLGTTTIVVSDPAGSGTANAPAFAIEMLNLVNAERAKAGARPLALCARLTAAADKFAEMMAELDYYSPEHFGPDGRRPQDRVSDEGYDWTQVGENEAAGQDSARAVMADWVDSDGHYANIIRSGYTHVGFGHGFSAKSTYGDYWVQDFGAGGTC